MCVVVVVMMMMMVVVCVWGDVTVFLFVFRYTHVFVAFIPCFNVRGFLSVCVMHLFASCR